MYDPETLAIGVLGRPHGVRGEIVLRPFNTVDGVRPLSPGMAGTVFLVRDGRTTERQLRSARAAGDHLLVSFVGVDSLEAARAITHSEVRVSRRALPALAPGEFYVDDVVGCEVVDIAGHRLGRATDCFWSGAHDVMTVIADDGREMLIPLVPDVIVAVEAPARQVRVRWQPGAEDGDG